MRLFEILAVNPRLERLTVFPPRYDEYLGRFFGFQDLHGNEPREILDVAAALGETLDDLIRSAFFNG
jgi:hypothetical protein